MANDLLSCADRRADPARDLFALLGNDALEFRYLAQQLHHRVLEPDMRQARHFGQGAHAQLASTS
jgi:hypothetical protein